MNIDVIVKNVYGNELIYPACATSYLLAESRGQRTFTEEDLSILRKLGYTVQVIHAKTALIERLTNG